MKRYIRSDLDYESKRDTAADAETESRIMKHFAGQDVVQSRLLRTWHH